MFLYLKKNWYDAYFYIFVAEKEYPNIKHSWDVWNGTKNLGEKNSESK